MRDLIETPLWVKSDSSPHYHSNRWLFIVLQALGILFSLLTLGAFFHTLHSHEEEKISAFLGTLILTISYGFLIQFLKFQGKYVFYPVLKPLVLLFIVFPLILGFLLSISFLFSVSTTVKWSDFPEEIFVVSTTLVASALLGWLAKCCQKLTPIGTMVRTLPPLVWLMSATVFSIGCVQLLDDVLLQKVESISAHALIVIKALILFSIAIYIRDLANLTLSEFAHENNHPHEIKNKINPLILNRTLPILVWSHL